MLKCNYIYSVMGPALLARSEADAYYHGSFLCGAADDHNGRW